MIVITIDQNAIEERLLPSLSPSTWWENFIPKKVNVFMWKFRLDRLLLRINLATRGINVASIQCHVCNNQLESMDHLFFVCETANNLWSRIKVWIDIDMPSCSSWYDWWQWFENIDQRHRKKEKIYAIGTATLWLLWRFL
ncbi:uncharacterized protein [Rutidosis leptorrhynchoides]|uniref:uncharacterized protein n=1 Tax=Rutidosis leptorrhynchoides TaxID=125765 RepID=UPI003A99ECA4